MKHFTFFFFATTLLCHGQIINFPDSNFKNALLNNNEVIDANGDGEIQISEAEVFSGILFLSDKNISDLTGIEYFINITKLFCNDNNLNQVDLTNNINVVEVSLSRNNLTSIDVSNNIKLEELELAQNQIQSIDLSNNILLEFLDISRNNLTELNLVNNSQLDFMICDYNQISIINLMTSNSTLRFLYCNNNQLTALDLTNQVILSSLDAGDNQLTNLDLTSQNELTWLKIKNNTLNSLDLSNLINLETLDCSNNYLTNLTLNSPNLWGTINCSNNLITDLTINSEPTDHYQNLNCSGNQLTELDLSNSSVASLLCSNNPDLENINWRSGWNYQFYEGYSGFQNLPNLSTVCIDSYNQELMDFVLAEVGHPVDFYNNETCDALSVHENNLNVLSITPNPAENSIKIESNAQINQIEIYNELGQLVQSNTLNSSTRQTDLNISALGQGLYFVKITDENGNSTIKKVIKK